MKSSHSQTNILISSTAKPRAILGDFCFARVAAVSIMGMSNDEQSTPSFTAPELLLPTRFGLEKGVPSKEADIYALGMTIYQVLAGKRPFLQRRKARIICAVILGDRPTKPDNAGEIGMTVAVWNLLEECWREDRMTRPSASDALRRLLDTTDKWNTADSMTEVGRPHTGNRGPTPSESTFVQRE